jgi:hypothetical protein
VEEIMISDKRNDEFIFILGIDGTHLPSCQPGVEVFAQFFKKEVIVMHSYISI